jgi:hypothetical protein
VVDLVARRLLLGEVEPAGPGVHGVLTGQTGRFTQRGTDGLVEHKHRLRSQTADSDQTKEQASVSLLSKDMAGGLLLIFLREARHRQPALPSVQVTGHDSGGGRSCS